MIRVGAVGYLNARPLTWALDRQPSQWRVRYDVPAVCARLLIEQHVDLGLIPSVGYLASPDYRLVPGVGIGSRGAVGSVALFTRMDVGDIRRIALDGSSRTSVALTRVLCARRFHITPEFVAGGTDLAAGLRLADAVLLIGDPALETDAAAHGARKIDLGAEWEALTGLPFVYAAWTGRPGVVAPADVASLQAAQDAGVAAIPAIAGEYGGEDAGKTARAAAYLRDNVRYGLGADEVAGLQLFLDFAADIDLGPSRTLEFY
jgi:chorismate dehydratase